MARSQQTMEPLQDVTVVDADVHVGYDSDVSRAVAEQLPQPYRDRVDPDAETFTSAVPNSGHGITIPGKLDLYDHPMGGPDDVREELCEKLGVDHPILNTLARLELYPDTQQIYPQMRASNNVLIERYLDGNDDFFGLASIVMREPHRAAEEIDRVADEDGIVGILIHPGGQERGLGDPRYDEVYRAAADNDLTVTFHTAGSGLMWNAPSMVRGLSTFFEVHTLNHPVAMMWTLTSLIRNGVPEKFPDIRFAILESGLGWVPYMIGRLNREYSQRRSEAPLLEKSPEAYIREQFYFGTQPLGEPNDPSILESTFEAVGTDAMMFSTDYPHWDFDNPETARKLLKLLSSDDRERVFNQNAIEAFQLPI